MTVTFADHGLMVPRKSRKTSYSAHHNSMIGEKNNSGGSHPRAGVE